jgi:tRNA (guanine-N7-)-methyltransferase
MSQFVEITDVCRPLNWPEIFGNDHPVEIDLGAGDGDFLLDWAARFPQRNFLAVERLLGRARKIERRGRRAELNNLRVLRFESAYTVRYLCPPGSVEILHLMFPDPWPKRKQQKNRLIQAEFGATLVRALTPAGEFRFTTDHAEYFETSCAVLDAVDGLRREPLWELENYPETDFQRQWREQGRDTFRARWRRV